MNEQKDKARQSNKFKLDNQKIDWTILKNTNKNSNFIGYELSNSNSNIMKYRQSADSYEIVLDKTPFMQNLEGKLVILGLYQMIILRLLFQILINMEMIFVIMDILKKEK